MMEINSHVVGLLVAFHGVCDVFNTLDGTTYIRIFGYGRVVSDRGWHGLP